MSFDKSCKIRFRLCSPYDSSESNACMEAPLSAKMSTIIPTSSACLSSP